MKNKLLLLSSPIIILPVSLFLVSCSSAEIKTKVDISINIDNLMKNFVVDGVEGAATRTSRFKRESIKVFVEKFNENPSLFITKNMTEFASTAFINVNSVMETDENLDIKIKVEKFDTFNSETLKFSFELKSSYTSEIKVNDEPDKIYKDIVAIGFRTTFKSTEGKEQQKEEDWLKIVFEKNNIEYLTKEVSTNTRKLKPSELISKINSNLNWFQDNLKFSTIELPIWSGWTFVLTAERLLESIPNYQNSINLIFTLENKLFINNDIKIKIVLSNLAEEKTPIGIN